MSARIEFRAAVVESFAVGLRGRCHWKIARDANRGSEQGGIKSTRTFDLRGNPESDKRGARNNTNQFTGVPDQYGPDQTTSLFPRQPKLGGGSSPHHAKPRRSRSMDNASSKGPGREANPHPYGHHAPNVMRIWENREGIAMPWRVLHRNKHVL